MQFKPPILTLQTFGASIGSKSVEVTITGAEESATPLVKSIQDVLSADEWNQLLIGEIQIVFKGDTGVDPAAETVRRGVLDFIEEISPLSLDYQVNVLHRKGQQLRPPFMVLITSGIHYTGKDEFYDNFNYVTAEISLLNSVKGGGKKLDERVHPFALIELSKHPFSTFVFRVKSENDWKEIEGDFLKTQYITVTKSRIFCIPDLDSVLTNRLVYAKAAWNIAVKNGVRGGLDLSMIWE